MEDQKRLSRYRRYRERRRRQPTSEDESLMRLLGLKSVQELDQWFRRGLSEKDMLDLKDMKPPDEEYEAAEKMYQEEEEDEERREEIDRLTMARNARIKPQLLRNLNHLGANPKPDPEVYRIVMKIGMINFEAGSREFLEWSARMVEDIGEPVRPILRDVWTRMPIEARRQGERKLRDVAAKREEIRKVRERIKLFREIERKPLGLVDVTGRTCSNLKKLQGKFGVWKFFARALGYLPVPPSCRHSYPLTVNIWSVAVAWRGAYGVERRWPGGWQDTFRVIRRDSD